jgi:hypothetical protein
MSKEQIHHIDEAKKPDGTIDHGIMLEHAAHAAGQIAQGHYHIVDAGQSTLHNGDVLGWFVRRETK